MKLKSLILLAVLSLTPCVFAADPVPNVAKETVVTKVPTFDEIVVSFIDKSAKIGDKIGDAASALGDLAAKEIPIVIREYLWWHWIESFLTFIFYLMVHIAAPYFIIKHLVCAKWNAPWEESGYPTATGVVAVASIIVSGVFILGGLCGGFTHDSKLDWLKISVAPHVYLIDEFSKVIKK